MAKKQKTLIEKLDAWHKTTHGFIFFALIEFAIAYGFISWAIDSGQLWQYFIGIIFFVGGVQNAVKLIKKVASS